MLSCLSNFITFWKFSGLIKASNLQGSKSYDCISSFVFYFIVFSKLFVGIHEGFIYSEVLYKEGRLELMSGDDRIYYFLLANSILEVISLMLFRYACFDEKALYKLFAGLYFINIEDKGTPPFFNNLRIEMRGLLKRRVKHIFTVMVLHTIYALFLAYLWVFRIHPNPDFPFTYVIYTLISVTAFVSNLLPIQSLAYSISVLCSFKYFSVSYILKCLAFHFEQINKDNYNSLYISNSFFSVVSLATRVKNALQFYCKRLSPIYAVFIFTQGLFPIWLFIAAYNNYLKSQYIHFWYSMVYIIGSVYLFLVLVTPAALISSSLTSFQSDLISSSSQSIYKMKSLESNQLQVSLLFQLPYLSKFRVMGYEITSSLLLRFFYLIGSILIYAISNNILLKL